MSWCKYCIYPLVSEPLKNHGVIFLFLIACIQSPGLRIWMGVTNFLNNHMLVFNSANFRNKDRKLMPLSLALKGPFLRVLGQPCSCLSYQLVSNLWWMLSFGSVSPAGGRGRSVSQPGTSGPGCTSPACSTCVKPCGTRVSHTVQGH